MLKTLHANHLPDYECVSYTHYQNLRLDLSNLFKVQNLETNKLFLKTIAGYAIDTYTTPMSNKKTHTSLHKDFALSMKKSREIQLITTASFFST